MSKRKLTILAGVSLFLLVYVTYGLWIAKDVRTILTIGMQPDSSYDNYMSEQAYHRLNPIRNGMTNSTYTYQSENHHIGPVFLFHFFVVAKTSTKQSFEFQNKSVSFGGTEVVKMTTKLKHGRWYASEIHIAP
ncbi:hypothetical protein [Paenibacillus glycanilyticus]|uniref:DUF3139 domain-containing protein n=1 Tax=Paenibacillus glycanilyticus TaxID=126569 RepID=A0ABQ6GG26_9BACL|nr:hypothetical protein [Paenibacillus glycanilyticus]GLX68002.1 hypothetical protein MU1_23470 [Paenibacillus glycanilyticus]